MGHTTRDEVLLTISNLKGGKLVPNHERVGIDGLQAVEKLQARQEAEAQSRSNTPRQAPFRLTDQELK
jgi:hypothetical protein